MQKRTNNALKHDYFNLMGNLKIETVNMWAFFFKALTHTLNLLKICFYQNRHVETEVESATESLLCCESTALFLFDANGSFSQQISKQCPLLAAEAAISRKYSTD
ncbi:hypothetical protein NPIL_603471 [Nephila pilipes]|uniref:Uncharacterized protein n=1 Tax=Nephila pilipes TaxID=299642 RepID=A0A8X6PTE8_NEPPI|nr:hypothetical protein NPIL_603471 [Nephila pilipes]